MPTLRCAIDSLMHGLSVLSLLSFFCVGAFAQTSLNDVHVVPLETSTAIAASGAHSPTNGSAFRVIKTDVNLVLVSVIVTDPMQRSVTGLGRQNFQVLEGKKPQEIRHFSSEDEPISVGIILDTSGSMTDKMERLHEAVKQFCESSNVQDEFFMITFSDEPHLAADFTSVPEDIERELLFTQPKGRTSLLDAIYMGLHKMKQAKYGKKALLIVSDGGDNHSRYTEKDVKAAVKESDVMIYAIGTFDRYVRTEEEMLGPSLLSEIAEPTGGRAFALENTNELPAVARHIGAELRTQYVLAYRPQDARHDGKWHRISVKLRLPRKLAFLRARSKTGYYAPGD